MSAPNGYQLSIATDEDVRACMDIAVPIFGTSSFGRRLIGEDSSGTRERAGKIHINAWRDHERRYPADENCQRTMYPLKIVYTDPAGGHEPEVVAFAEWYIHPRERLIAEINVPLYLHDPAYVAADLRDEFESLLRPFVEARKRHVGTQSHALLMYLCVSPQHRRKGLGELCVRWGMEKCAELGIRGYLISSEDGKHVYSKLGWQTVEVIDGSGAPAAAMIWIPE